MTKIKSGAKTKTAIKTASKTAVKPAINTASKIVSKTKSKKTIKVQEKILAKSLSKSEVNLYKDTENDNLKISVVSTDHAPKKVIAMSTKAIQELTLKNHFQFGYDGVPFNFRTSSLQTWWVNYGRCSRWPLDWRSECILAARQIRAATSREIWVCFSGGIDSEVVAESFRYGRIAFRAAILRFNNDLNIQDISWAVSYCERYNIPYEFFNFNVADFFEGGEMMHYADLTQCPTPQLPSSMKLMELIAKRGGYPVLGSAECYLNRHQDGWYMYEREKIASLYRFLLKTGYPGQAGFFQWSPEIMYSFLVDPMVKKLVENQMPPHNDTYYIKPEIYAQYWNLRPRTKYTGFEKVFQFDRKWRPILEQKYGYCNEQVYIPYLDLVRSLAYVNRSEENKPNEHILA